MLSYLLIVALGPTLAIAAPQAESVPGMLGGASIPQAGSGLLLLIGLVFLGSAVILRKVVKRPPTKKKPELEPNTTVTN
jgi:hypothetical protein